MLKLSEPARRVVRLVGAVVGLGLLAAAVVLALRHVELATLMRARPRQWAGIGAGVLANLGLAAGLFWVVTLSFDARPAVRYGRMLQLICASALVNYLPLQAGLVGRAAWLKLRHELPLRQSAAILAAVMAVTMVVTVAIVLLGPVTPAGMGERLFVWVTFVAIAGVASLATGPAAGLVFRRPIRLAGLWLPIKIADVLVSGVRIFVAFAVVGHPVTYGQAVVVAAAGALVSMLAPTPNGLGLKEWAMAAAALATGTSSADVALAASVVDRGVEAIITAAAGTAALMVMLKQIKGPGERTEMVKGSEV